VGRDRNRRAAVLRPDRVTGSPAVGGQKSIYRAWSDFCPPTPSSSMSNSQQATEQRKRRCGVHKVRRVRSRTLNRPVNCLGLMEAFARFSSDSDGSNAIEEPRVGFRVRRVVYPVGGTSRHPLLPPTGSESAPATRKIAVLGRCGEADRPSGRVQNRGPGCHHLFTFWCWRRSGSLPDWQMSGGEAHGPSTR
jgi:hypothetical protein